MTLKIHLALVCVLSVFFGAATPAFCQRDFFINTPPGTNTDTVDFNTVLMKTTFQLVGPTKPKLCGLSGIVSGTCFIVTAPVKKIYNGTEHSRLFMVTAAHVLEDICGDTALIRFRKQDGESWSTTEIALSIRRKGTELWHKHPGADVAAIELLEHIDQGQFDTIERNIGNLTFDKIADDKWMEDYKVHPGEDLLCLGYPLFAPANKEGFPVLRGGRLASYPILPTSIHDHFLFDFEVFEGNSGGPVYMCQESRSVPERGTKLGVTSAVLGVLTHSIEMDQPLKMGVVVPGRFVIEAITSVLMRNL